MLSKVTDALGKTIPQTHQASKFYSEFELTSDDFSIGIDDGHPIKLPIVADDIQKLLNISHDAKFGLREDTLLDKQIRDTKEISADKLQVKCNEARLSDLLNKVRKDLGLSEGSKLTAHLHNMLIYGQGQFFKPHQDSEKLEGMVATLVIVLPFPHIGGAMLINHGDEQHKFVTENIDSQSLKCIAFYADCPHEVKKIKQGFRVVLTYNLVLENQEIEFNKYNNKELETALETYFEEKKLPDSEPRKLVFLLDHRYTEHSLNWHMLKGSDRDNAWMLLVAAKKLDLKPYLGLVDLHEVWDTDGDEENPELYELIDSSTTLSYWINEHNVSLPYAGYSIPRDELCWQIETSDLTPFETEYEGWMGNYGNTADYWYRRAAVVLWNTSDQPALEFKYNYDAAMDNLLQMMKKPDQCEQVLEIVKKAKRYLLKSKSKSFKDLVRVALYLKDAPMAQSLLSQFSMNLFTEGIIDELVKLQNLFGIPWTLALLKNWRDQKSKYYRARDIKVSIDTLISSMIASGIDKQLVKFLFEYKLHIIKERSKDDKKSKPANLTRSLDERLDSL
ncbi:MAG: 2OG-Fe(II) oxygenase [Pseudomonadota bacterium]